MIYICAMAPTPNINLTLVSLVAELQRRARAGASQGVLVGWLYHLSKGLGIRMRYDEHEVATPPQSNTVAEKTSDARQSKRRGRPIPYTITKGHMVLHFDDAALLEHDPPPGGDFGHLIAGEKLVGRIILSCDRRHGNATAPLCVESNGAVIDAQTWRLLAVPPRAFTTQPVVREVDRGLSVPDSDGQVRTGIYDIIRVNDGTIVTLYRWEHPKKGPVWCLASSNGYDVSHLKWMGDKTYAELVYELLAAYPEFVAATGAQLLYDHLCKNDVRLNFTLLDPDNCYTIGFRHSNFHPLAADPPGIWTIQTTKLTSGVPRFSAALPAIPQQTFVSREDIIHLAAVRGRSAGVGGGGLVVADFVHISRSALIDAKAIIAGGGSAESFNYGFILRPRNPGANVSYDILCESPLLRRVRHLMYKRPHNDVNEELTEKTRLEYNALRGFLTIPDRQDFIELFPEFRPRFKVYDNFLSETVNQILRFAREQNLAPEKTTVSQIVAWTMFAHIRKYQKDFDVFDEKARFIISDCITRPDYTTLYLKAILPADRPAQETVDPES